MVWEPKTCCCVCSLKTGTIILGWLGLIGSILSVLFVLSAATSSLEICYEMWRYMGRDYYSSIESCDNGGSFAVIVALLFITLLATAICIMLIRGVDQNKPMLMLPYLICQVICVVFVGIAGVIIFIVFCYKNLLFIAFIMVVKFGLLIFLEIYYLLVVRACYKEVKQHRMAMGSANKIAYWEHQDIPSMMQDIPSMMQDNPSMMQDIPSKMQDIPSKMQDIPIKM